MQQVIKTATITGKLTDDQEEALNAILRAFLESNPYPSLLSMYAFDLPAEELYKTCERYCEQPKLLSLQRQTVDPC